ncbi:hypothetical protein Nepgr_013329 [Nepenthes gracilis]|uniref:RING-type domain-containing protein n=1 Tax=Nepenthes gracilis TaxID=150966 RepID=A0AAD3XNW4_NEPGR|nr:hypothetical protein Nepgr_013329 [Nepenthes gracilis]
MQMDAHYIRYDTPYSTTGSFMDFFDGLTYDHVNYIFESASHMQESAYPSMSTGYFKFGHSEPGATQYYSDDIGHSYWVYDHSDSIEEYIRPAESSVGMTNEQTATVNQQMETVPNTSTHTNNRDCPRSHHDSHDYQVIWQDNVDPDNMTYEELLELGDAVGTQSRGLSQELISMLPVSNFKCHFFLRKKSRTERCVICQMEYRRGDRLITLPCKHKYHKGCGTKWLSINKACPICYSEVCFDDAAKKQKKC